LKKKTEELMKSFKESSSNSINNSNIFIYRKICIYWSNR